MSDLNIKDIRTKLGVTQKQLAEKIGVSVNTIQNWEYGGTIPKSKYPILSKILESEPHIEQQQFFGGNQESSHVEDVYASLPLIPIDAVAGFPVSDNAGILFQDCECYNVPEFVSKGAQFLIRVSGSSMYPKYSNGDLLACKKIDEITFFQWGKVYVLDTRQGALVKRIFEDKDNEDNIICHSDNHDNYPDFKLPKVEIRSLSIVIGVIRLD